jgi:hypothetical protein
MQDNVVGTEEVRNTKRILVVEVKERNLLGY